MKFTDVIDAALDRSIVLGYTKSAPGFAARGGRPTLE
jgi:hypothetical protein